MAAITRQPAGAAGPTTVVPFLLRLYPAAWRARYGDEFRELLESRPPGPRDRLDIIRGAIDARIHPQVADHLPPRVASGRDRLLALTAVTVGVLFAVWAGIIVAAAPRWGMGANVDDGLIAASFTAGCIGGMLAIAVLIGVAVRYVDELGSAGTLGALLAAIAFLLTLGDSDAIGVLALVLGTLMLGPGLARIVPWPIAALLAAATIGMALSMFGFVASDGQQLLWLWLGIVYGPSWVLLGICLRRGARRTLVATVGA